MEVITKEKPNKKQYTSISIQGMNTIVFQMENCFYKIQKEDKTGAGFMCKIPFSNDLKYFLITNYSLLNEKDINLNETIKLKSIKKKEQKIRDGNEEYSENEEIQIKIDITRIKACINEKITIIEIKPNKDKIFIKTILDLDKEENYNNIGNLKLENNKKSIYIIDKEKLTFSDRIIEGSFGSPILSLETFKIIGIYSDNKGNINENIISMNYLIDELYKKNNIYKNEIELIYVNNNKNDEVELFGGKFVENHKNDIELIINDKKSKLVKKWKFLKEGENKIKMIIKKKISNFERMFEGCRSLRNISQLRNLDTNNINNFSYMFSGCKLLSDITSLEEWNVSNAINFKDMFCECNKLEDIRPLKKWNVSKVQIFSNMFSGCSQLFNIMPLKDWDVSNAIDFSNMFSECYELEDIRPLKDWNVSKAYHFSEMFRECKKLHYIDSLKNWNVLEATNFSLMFHRCELLSDIKSLKDWNVSNGINFSDMFSRCSNLSDIQPLSNWKLNESNSKDFSNMFNKCKQLSNIQPLKEWKVSNKDKFDKMFGDCSSLSVNEPLKQWNLPDKVFKEMFD